MLSLRKREHSTIFRLQGGRLSEWPKIGGEAVSREQEEHWCQTTVMLAEATKVMIFNACRAFSRAMFVRGNTRDDKISFLDGPLSRWADLVTAATSLLQLSSKLPYPHSTNKRTRDESSVARHGKFWGGTALELTVKSRHLRLMTRMELESALVRFSGTDTHHEPTLF
jgi:hypothetical protein